MEYVETIIIVTRAIIGISGVYFHAQFITVVHLQWYVGQFQNFRSATFQYKGLQALPELRGGIA